MQKQWHEIKMGALLKVEKDTEFPADMLLLKSSRDNGVVFVETLNLDGESAMK
jgi:magnesium-transporting ATPase (P-type)